MQKVNNLQDYCLQRGWQTFVDGDYNWLYSPGEKFHLNSEESYLYYCLGTVNQDDDDFCVYIDVTLPLAKQIKLLKCFMETYSE